MFHTMFLICIYVIPWNCCLIFLKTAYAILMFHTIFLIYICAFVKINEFDVPHDVPHIYICVSLSFLCFMFHTMFRIYIAKTSMGVTLMFHKGASTEARGHVLQQ